MILAWITLLSAIAISSVAAWYSIVGLVQIFPAVTLPIILLGSVLEIGKVVAVVWVHRNWRLVEARFLKPYLVTAIGILMIVTAIGIYGFMSKSHLQQQAETLVPTMNLEQVEAKLQSVDSKLARATKTASQMDAALDAYIARGYITKGLKQRQTMEQERATLDKNIEALTNEKRELQLQRQQANLVVKNIEIEFGPIKYVADLFGYTDLDSAVRILILMIMFVFDPLALCLMVAAQVSFSQNRKIGLYNPYTQTITVPENAQTVTVSSYGGGGGGGDSSPPVTFPDRPVIPTKPAVFDGKSKKDPWYRRLQKR